MTREVGKKPTTTTAITERFTRIICKRLRAGQRVRRNLPESGRLHVDRPLPFLCVYRQPASVPDLGTARLATSEASYLICSAKRRLQPGLQTLVEKVTLELSEQFGACLLLEIWSAPPKTVDGPVSTADLTPEFRIMAPREGANGGMVDEFADALSRIRLGKRKAVVRQANSTRCAPKALPVLMPPERAAEIGCHVYGLEIAPIYRDTETGDVFPQVLRQLRHQLTVALRRSFFRFSQKSTTHRPAHFHSLGRRTVVKAVWDADRALAEASDQFDFLLLVTPVNGEQAWSEFQHRGYRRQPAFHYRPLPADPVTLKRNLYKAPVERVEDPALAQVFREKLDETDRQITLLQDRNTPRFLPGSLQLYGGVEDDLHDLALEILREVPPHSRDERSRETLSPQQFADLARSEIARFKSRLASVDATVELRDDITGLMVSNGSLLVSSRMHIPASRADALIQHEVGTHVLTYHNGRAQRFRQLYAGLAGYDALQEGLAVLAEYLVDGLSRPRLRLLAGRVVAARMLLDNASFAETYHALAEVHEFPKRTAFLVTMRTYRGGGLTKDAVYLRGLRQILDHLGRGGDLEPLFIGKIAIQHIPIVRELQWRGVLRDPPLVPHYMSRPDVLARLEGLRRGVSPKDLIPKRRKR